MLTSLNERRPPASRTRPARLEICPPQRSFAAQAWLLRVRSWLSAGWNGTPMQEDGGADRSLVLAAARQDFFQSVVDLTLPAAGKLLDRIEFARTMRDLWHLRAEVFALVSLERSQQEADRRLTLLNRHFPTRAPRSGFGGLAPKDMWP